MSAEINNREYRQQVLKELISQLHDGKSVDEVKDQFAAVFGNVSAEEIAQAEQALILGGLPFATFTPLFLRVRLKKSISRPTRPKSPGTRSTHCGGKTGRWKR